jgi:hypothetical protein
VIGLYFVIGFLTITVTLKDISFENFEAFMKNELLQKCLITGGRAIL